MAAVQIVVTVDPAHPQRPAVAAAAQATDPTSVSFAAQNKATIDSTLAQASAAFYAAHTAADHPRQRQKLAAAFQSALVVPFPAQAFAVQTVVGVVSASALGKG